MKYFCLAFFSSTDFLRFKLITVMIYSIHMDDVYMEVVVLFTSYYFHVIAVFSRNSFMVTSIVAVFDNFLTCLRSKGYQFTYAFVYTFILL